MTIGIFYASCLALGLGYAILSAGLGWLFDHGDVQVDATGHLDAGSPSPVSGTSNRIPVALTGSKL